MNRPIWHHTFAPSYTPKEMLDLGVFEGTYIRAIKRLPSELKNHPKSLSKGDDPDPTINRFKIKSRLSLTEWQKKGWIMTDPNGWFEWYVRYFYEGRRLGEEDITQINRWRSYIARHQGQINANCKLNDHDCRPKQRQGLLQWAWDSDTKFTDKQLDKNLKRIIKVSGHRLSTEDIYTW